MKSMIFDTHAHYDDDAFNGDRDELISSLSLNNICAVVNAGSSVESNYLIKDLSEKYPVIYQAAGVHPDDIDGLNEETFEKIAKLCREEKTVAVGEVGFDYYHNKENKDQQRYWFERFIDLSKKEDLPLMIHSREAALDTMDTIRANKAYETGSIMHCYSYSKETARELLDMGFYFGIGGVLTFKNAKKLAETVDYLPMSAMLLETDCPYLAPVPYRGKRNCSLYIPYVVERIAEIKNISVEEVMDITCENAYRLFKKVKRD